MNLLKVIFVDVCVCLCISNFIHFYTFRPDIHFSTSRLPSIWQLIYIHRNPHGEWSSYRRRNCKPESHQKHKRFGLLYFACSLFFGEPAQCRLSIQREKLCICKTMFSEKQRKPSNFWTSAISPARQLNCARLLGVRLIFFRFHYVLPGTHINIYVTHNMYKCIYSHRLQL